MIKNKISVICPVYNGKKFIKPFSKSIDNLHIPKDVSFELFLIDNCSNDDSYLVLSKWINSYNNRNNNNIILKKFNRQKSSYATRNFGVKLTSGDVICFVDIDCVIPNDYLINVKKKIPINKQKYLIAGDVKLFKNEEDNIFEYYDLILGFNMKTYFEQKTGVTANLIVSKNLINEIGGFDEYKSGADRNFCKNAVKNYNASFFSCNDILVYHPCRNTLKEHLNKIHRICNGIAKYNKKLPFYSIVLYVFKQIIGSVFQINQIKQIILRRQIFKKLSIVNKFKLVLLIFLLGAYNRIYLATKTIKFY